MSSFASKRLSTCKLYHSNTSPSVVTRTSYDNSAKSLAAFWTDCMGTHYTATRLFPSARGVTFASRNAYFAVEVAESEINLSFNRNRPFIKQKKNLI
jgi:hypothetical protein